MTNISWDDDIQNNAVNTNMTDSTIHHVEEQQEEPEEKETTEETMDELDTPEQKIDIIASLHSIQEQISQLMIHLGNNPEQQYASIKQTTKRADQPVDAESTIIEGVFTGKQMMGEDGHAYDVSENYASKSKLVEGDVMKLTISPKGSYIYKQISPVERKKLTGELILNQETNTWSVIAEGRPYNVLTAAVTYHKGNPGDAVVIIIPSTGSAAWAAIERFER